MSEATTATTSHGTAQNADETILLRRYSIAPGRWDGFLDIWHEIVPLRQRHGFEVLFALADKESNVFTWAIRHRGDVEAAAEAYYSDPARAALERVSEYVTDFEVTTVTRIL